MELKNGSDIANLIGRVPGPKDTPYEGGLYEIEIHLADQYPFVPPKMRFITKASLVMDAVLSIC